MPDSKITALTSISTSTDPANDPLVIVDVSDTSMAATGTTKKVTLNQLLGASGTATLASATITGALAANADTTLGTASKSTNTNLNLSSDLGTQRIYLDRGTRSLVFQDVTSSIENYRIAGITGVHTWGVGGSTAMTLNSTGLGVGAVPSVSKVVVATGALPGIDLFRSDANANFSGIRFRNSANSATNAQIGWNGNELRLEATTSFSLATNGVENRISVDGSGNVGIGVTPSAWQSSWKALDIGLLGGISYGFGETNITSNVYRLNTGASRYKAAGSAATVYAQVTGSHIFYTAGVAANANDPITFTTAMTLDASGNLLVGKTAASVTTIGFQTLANGEASVAMAASTSASSTLNVWSTGAAAFRFYVAMNGTISATNTTISAISDARLKENVQDIDVGLGAILALKPRKFDWKAGKGKDIKGDRGFIAQEFEQVFPNLIDEWKDPAPEGEAPYKSVRQDLIPVLVKAIQELTARVQTLETR